MGTILGIVLPFLLSCSGDKAKDIGGETLDITDTKEVLDFPQDEGVSDISVDLTEETLQETSNKSDVTELFDTDIEYANEIEENNEVEEVEPSPEIYKLNGDCATPLDFDFKKCEVVDCPEGMICMGDGICVPSKPFALQSEISKSQVKPAIFANKDGTFVMAWYEVGQNSEWMDIYFRLFFPDGTSKTPPVKVDMDEMKWARSPTIAGLKDNKYLVIWRSQDGNSGNVAYHGRIINSDGLPEGSSFQINTTPLESELAVSTNVDSPFARLLRDQNVGVAWSGEPKGQTHNVNVYLRVFTLDGKPATPEIDIGGATDADEGSVSVSALPKEGMLVFWQAGKLWEKYRVIGAKVTGLGKVEIPATPLSQGVEAYQGAPAGTVFEDGTLLLTWKTMKNPAQTDETLIKAGIFNSNDLSPLKFFDVGVDPEGIYPFYAQVEAGKWERAVIVWHSCSSGDKNGIWIRRFYLKDKVIDCQPTEIALDLAEGETGCRYMPVITTFEDGRFLVAWNSSFGSSTKIFMRFVK